MIKYSLNELEILRNEWLTTLDNDKKEEQYDTLRGHGLEWTGEFLSWLEEREKKS